MKTLIHVILFVAAPLVAVDGISQPIITRQPDDISASIGARIVNRVNATGTAPVTYRWRFNGEDLPETSSTLVITNIQQVHEGSYSAIASDSSGSVTSRVAVIDVDPTFTKVTTGHIVMQTGQAWGCSWGDYDNDDYPDLFVSNLGSNSVFRNNRDGTFTRITSGAISTIQSGGAGAVWVDYDNDGDLDLITAGFGGNRNAIYRNDGAGNFRRLTVAEAGPFTTSGGGAFAASVADFDKDGWVDVFVANRNSADELFRGSPTGIFTRMTNSPVAVPGIPSMMGLWGDYDNDMDPDLVVLTHADSPKQRVSVFRNDAGSFTPMQYSEIGDVFSIYGGTGGAWGDFDNDGDLDLYIAPHLAHNDSINDQILARNNGNGTFTRLTSDMAGPVVTGNRPVSCAWADYDNDGHLDLFVTDSGGHPGKPRGPGNRLYRNNGNGAFTQITTGSLVNEPSWSISAAWADHDNDGFMDLFVANGGDNAQENFFYKNNGNSNHWLKVKLVGTASNRSAVGAKVRVYATIHGQPVWQMREICAGEGFWSQGDLRPNFGMGDSAVAERVRIEWPSGIVQEIHHLPANQIHTIVEPPRLSAMPGRDNAPVEINASVWTNFALSVEVSENLENWAALQSYTNLSGTIRFRDGSPDNSAKRFYRARIE